MPCFNEQESIPLFYKEFNKVTASFKEKILFEFIFIDDGSKDNGSIIKEGTYQYQILNPPLLL